MVSMHPPSLDRDTNAIEHLDFAPPCGYRDHRRVGDGPATLAVWYRNPQPCGCPGMFKYFCDACWEYRASLGWVHCDHHTELLRFPCMASIARVERI